MEWEGDRPIDFDKIEKDLIKAGTNDSKIKIMEKYFQKAILKDIENPNSYLSANNRFFKKYNSGMIRSDLKSELNAARKQLYNKYKAELNSK